MSSKSVTEGFLLSSTPVQSLEEDSGYFGSYQKKNYYTLNTYSPIKGLCFDVSGCSPLEQDCDKNSFQQPESNKKVLDYENFRNKVYESSSFGTDEFSELELMHDSVIREGGRDNLSEQKYLDEASFSKNAENQDFAFISSTDKDNKVGLYENKPGDLKNENCNGFEKLSSISPLSYAHVKHKFQSLTVFKQTKIDFLHCLNEINCLSIISYILSCLSAKELCTSSCVNKEWKQIIQSDRKANSRRKKFIRERDLFFNGPFKENRLGMKTGPARQLKKAFFDLTNGNTDEQPLVAKHSNSSRFDSFLKESENGHLKLQKCPKCCYASKSLTGNNYKCTNCLHVFCSRCLDPVFKNHSCNKSQLPNTIIGSKKSKRNLKRL